MYTAKDYGKLIGMEGFSDALLNNHFTLYQGYVTNTNKLLDIFGQLKDACLRPEFAELHRRLGWEFNGMRLHEYYFENLGGKGVEKDGKLAEAGRGLREPRCVGEGFQGRRRHAGHRLGRPLPGRH